MEHALLTLPELELAFGNYVSGRFAWQLEIVRLYNDINDDEGKSGCQ